MKETRFIAQNKEKWRESESLLENESKDPEKLTSLFTQVIDDLSYSRTYYPNRSVRVYLNKIARQYFSIIYSKRSNRKNRFSHFWMDELPQVIIHCRKELIISLLIFLGSMAIGIFSSINDPDFASTILGDSYITMTNENIAKGDPMAVYKSRHETEMFLGITINNLMVAFRTYVLGVFLAVGTLGSLLVNGIMVGCFQYFFIERGLFVESALTIWLHGTLEISSIVLAGGAGLALGRGLIFPGTYSRIQSFQISAIRSLKLMLGISPVFVLAAIIESFVTRYTDVPDLLKLSVILLSAAFIIGYFAVYPWMKARTGFDEPLNEVRLPPSLDEPVTFSKLKNNAEILKDTFHFFTRNANAFLSWVIIISAAQAGFIEYLRESESAAVTYITDSWLQQLFSNMFFAAHTETPVFIVINSVCVSLILYRTFTLLDGEFRKSKPALNLKSLLNISIISLLIYGLVYLGIWGVIVLLAVVALFLLIAFAQLAEKSNLAAGAASGWTLAIAGAKQVFEFQVMILVLCFSFLMVLSAPLLLIHTSILQWNFALTDTWGQTALQYITTFIKVTSFNLIIPILAAGAGYMYFTLQEINTATHLKEAILRIGMRPQKTKR